MIYANTGSALPTSVTGPHSPTHPLRQRHKMKQGRGRFLVAGFPQKGCVLIISLELKILYRGPWVGKSVFPRGLSQFFGMFKVCLFEDLPFLICCFGVFSVDGTVPFPWGGFCFSSLECRVLRPSLLKKKTHHLENCKGFILNYSVGEPKPSY